jgi:hypothetical protein
VTLAACRDDELQSVHAGPYITGVIASRAPGEIFVVHSASCDSEATVSLFFAPRVVDAAGSNADTSVLTVGRRVSVWLSPGVAIDESCPPGVAARLIVLEN